MEVRSGRTGNSPTRPYGSTLADRTHAVQTKSVDPRHMNLVKYAVMQPQRAISQYIEQNDKIALHLISPSPG